MGYWKTNPDGTKTYVNYEPEPEPTPPDPAPVSGDFNPPHSSLVATGPTPGSQIWASSPEALDETLRQLGSAPSPSGGYGGAQDRGNFNQAVNFIMTEHNLTRPEAEKVVRGQTTTTTPTAQPPRPRSHSADYSLLAQNNYAGFKPQSDKWPIINRKPPHRPERYKPRSIEPTGAELLSEPGYYGYTITARTETPTGEVVGLTAFDKTSKVQGISTDKQGNTVITFEELKPHQTLTLTDPVKVKALEISQRLGAGTPESYGKRWLTEQIYPYVSKENPFGIKSAVTWTAGKITGEDKTQELLTIQARSELEVEGALIGTSTTEKAIFLATSPATQMGLAFGMGAGIGAGMGAFTKLAPNLASKTGAVLTVAGVSYMAFDITRQYKKGGSIEAVTRAVQFALAVPVAMSGYKSGYTRGYNYASAKWDARHFQLTRADITHKEITKSGDVLYQGKFKALYDPNLESTGGRIDGTFKGLAPRTPTKIITSPNNVINVGPHEALTSFTGTLTYTAGGKEHVVPINAMSKTFKGFQVAPGKSLFPTISRTVTGKQETFGFTQTFQRTIGTQLEPYFQRVDLHYFKKTDYFPGLGLSGKDTLGFTVRAEPSIYVRTGLDKTTTKLANILTRREHAGTQRVAKHELLHRLNPFASESEIIALEHHPNAKLDKFLTSHFKKGHDFNYFETTGSAQYKYSLFDSGTMSLNPVKKTWSLGTEKGALKEIMAKWVVTEPPQTYAYAGTTPTPAPAPTVSIITYPEVGAGAVQFAPSMPAPPPGRVIIPTGISGQSRTNREGLVTGSSQILTTYTATRTRSRVGIISLIGQGSQLRARVLTLSDAVTMRDRTAQAVSMRSAQLQRVSTRRALLQISGQTQTARSPIHLNIKTPLIVVPGGPDPTSQFSLKKTRKRRTTTRRSRKPRLVVKSIKADLLSIQQEESTTKRRAKHPRPTKALWRFAEKKNFLRVPTARQFKRRRLKGL